MSRKLKPQPKLAVAKKQPPRWQRERNISLLIRIIIPLIIVVALGLVGYWAYDNYIAPWQQPVAKVNDTTIDMRYFIKMLRYYSGGTKDKNVLRGIAPGVLEQIESKELIRQGALALDIKVTPEEITEKIENDLLAAQGNTTQPEIDLDQHYKQVRERIGLSVAEYREIAETELLFLKIRGYLKDQKVPEEAKHIHLLTLERPSEAEALEALVGLQKGNATLEEELAAGDLGWVPEGIYPELDEVAFGLEAGNVTGPVETIRDEKLVYTLVSVSEIVESMTVDDEHRETLSDIEFEKWLQEEREASIIKEYLDPGKTTWALDHI